MALNRVTLVGRLTRDPELKYTPAAVPVASMGIAVKRMTKDEAGNYEVDFFNITAWRRTAEFAGNYLKKGRLVSVDGRLQTRSWVDQATGMKRSAVDIVAEHLDPVGPRPADDGEGSDEPAPSAETRRPPQRTAPAATPGQPQRPSAASSYQAIEDEEESDPFADE